MDFSTFGVILFLTTAFSNQQEISFSIDQFPHYQSQPKKPHKLHKTHKKHQKLAQFKTIPYFRFELGYARVL